ncbi:rab effector MyRIP-like, partial [Notothenia coriiceps]|uniref:Rab effector MyRIP-like n=1 Tax=Notothenia coriiceps TaxID=8208 RepID=A0A6I9P018_9TELE
MYVSLSSSPPSPPLKENSGFLLNALLKRGLSEEQAVPDPVPSAAPDAFKSDAMTPEPEDLDTAAPNSAAPSPPQRQSVAPGPPPADSLEEELRARLSQLVSRANSKDCSSSEEEEESTKRTIDTERQRGSDRLSEEREEERETVEQGNGPEERLIKSPSEREEMRLETGVECLEEKEEEWQPKRGDKRQSKRQHKRDAEKEARRSGSSASSPAVTPSFQEGALSDNQEEQHDL